MTRSGVSYSSYLEWRLAAQWAGYTWEQFETLPGEGQSAVVATYRAYNQIEAVVADSQNKRIEAENARNGRKQR